MDLGSIVGHERTKSKIGDDVLTSLKQDSKTEKVPQNLLADLIRESVNDAVESISMGISSWKVSSETFVEAQNMVLKRAIQNANKKIVTIDVPSETTQYAPERAFVEQEQMNHILESREPHMLKSLQENAMNAKDEDLDWSTMRQWAPKKKSSDE